MKHLKRAVAFILCLLIVGLVLFYVGFLHLSDLSQAVGFALVTGIGGAFMYGWGDRLMPRQLREGLSMRGVPESQEERLQLFRRFYPLTMLRLEQPLDRMAAELVRLQGSKALEATIRMWMAQDDIDRAESLNEDELAQVDALEGEVMHYALEQISKGQLMQMATAVSPNHSDSSGEQTWLKEKFPRVFDYVSAFSYFTTERDYQIAAAELDVMLGLEKIAETPWRRTASSAMNRVHAEAIAKAILLSKKRIPPKRHWWS